MKPVSRLSIAILCLLLVGCAENPTQNRTQSVADLNCVDGMSAGRYSCSNIDLLAQLTVDELLAEPFESGSALNDIWGWTDPDTGIEYALVGLNDGVTFVDLSSPSEPLVVGKLKETASVSDNSSPAPGGDFLYHDEKSTWRDFKVYDDHLFVVSDAQPHGMQVFDLRRLRNVEDPPASFGEDFLYEEFANAHNIAVNEQSGYAYVVGSDTYGGGLHIIDISNPLNPRFAGSHSDSTVGRDSTGYVHDTQCVNYHGPDPDYAGEEICMNSSETHLVVARVTDKQQTATVAKKSYPGNAYAHQGWLTEDHRYFLLDDEIDELQGSSGTRTYIWDVRDLDNPELIGVHEANFGSIDHNQYVKGSYVYQANYTAGLRILSLENISAGELEEVAHFDTYPGNNDAVFQGAWSNYPYFESGLVVVGDISNGLYVLKPDLE